MTPAWYAIYQVVLVRTNSVVLVYFLFVNTFYFVLLVSAAWGLRQHLLNTRGETRWRVLGSRVAPRISVLVPAYNEVATVSENVRSLLTLYYPNLEVVLVNDGSTDETLAVLVKEFELVPVHPIYRYQVKTKPVRGLYLSRTHPNLVVVNKENGGKADALNAGLNLATGKLVCAIDADSLIEADALQRMVRPFLASDQVVAAGGTVRVANASVVKGGRVVEPHAPRRPLPGFQVVEYLRAFRFGRLGWNNLGDNLIISGAFGLFSRQAMIDIGGYERATVAEDFEIVVRLRRHAYDQKTPHRVIFTPDPIAWTEVPESLRVLARQRDRWHRGLAEVLWRHRRLLFNPAYGTMAMVPFPYFVFLELLAPVLEALGLAALTLALIVGAVDARFAVLFFLCAYGYGLILGVFALLLDEMSYRRYEQVNDRLILLGWALLENCGYRQLTVFWRLKGLIKFLRGKTDWGVMERRGFREPAAHRALASGKRLS